MNNEENGIVNIVKDAYEDTKEIVTENIIGVGEIAKNTAKTAQYLIGDIGNAITGENTNKSDSPSENGNSDESSNESSENSESELDPSFIPGTDECNKRLAEMEKTYILHTAVLYCDKAARFSHLVLPKSHGEFIHGIPQLNVGDCIPNKNILSFGVCTSPLNPSVQEAAEKILDDVRKEHEDDFTTKVCHFFGKKTSAEKVCTNEKESLAAICAGVCNPQIFVDEWPDGKEDLIIEGKKALLGRCKLSCGYGGTIIIFTSGQRE